MTIEKLERFKPVLVGDHIPIAKMESSEYGVYVFMSDAYARESALLEALKALEKDCTQGMESGDWGIDQWPQLAEARDMIREIEATR